MANKRTKQRWVSVFVYGTLKRNFPLHEWLEGSKYLGAETIVGYSLISLGQYPALIGCVKEDGQPDKNYKVDGELWSMPEHIFEQLRRMEERVGYTTILVETAVAKVQAACFLFDVVQRGTVEWAKEGETNYRVKPVVPTKNDIPF